MLNFIFLLWDTDRYLASLKPEVIVDTAPDISILVINDPMAEYENVRRSTPMDIADKSSTTVNPFLFFIFKKFFDCFRTEISYKGKIFDKEIIGGDRFQAIPGSYLNDSGIIQFSAIDVPLYQYFRIFIHDLPVDVDRTEYFNGSGTGK